MITIERADAVLVQDLGRPRFADQGVPRSGAFDRERYVHACALMGEQGAPVFELIAGTFAFRTDDAVTVGVVGVFASGTFAHSFTLPAHGELALTVTEGPGYVAVKGLEVPRTLESASTDLVSGIGPERVQAGMRFTAQGIAPAGQITRTPVVGEIGYLGDPLPRQWQVVSHSRSGTRITPIEPWVVDPQIGLPSRPVLPGAIQVVSATEAIILGPDSGVTGGYPVAALVCTADLPRIARLRDGHDVVLESITLEEAVARERELQQFRMVRLP